MYTKADFEALKLHLQSLSSGEEYIAFHKRTTPGVEHSYGVRVPQLRKEAKQLLKQDWRGFIAQNDHSASELSMLEAMLIGGAPCDLNERLSLITAFVPRIDNWCFCDTICADVKPKPAELDAYWDFLTPYLTSEQEYELRFGVVMLLDHFLLDDYIDRVLEILVRVQHDGYYVKMGVAWALATAMVRYSDKVIPLIQNGCIQDKFTHNKTIQKCIESFRVTDEDKQLLRTLRRK
ncbi:DNA alkylation repair protein [Eubacteriales bacterium OttesenSCG-928-N13]|nr:DNA alkylation repair protein [Eubacteriales bacterium OttesenSCG-928-N13]